MWAEAAKHVAKYSEGVINALDADGYPVSVRQTTLRYDASSGTMPVVLPDALNAQEGPASLLCHFHDDKLWSLRSIQLKGRIERRDGAWTFVTTAFNAPSPIAQLRGMQRSMKRYLEKRGLQKPRIPFDVVARLREEAKRIENP